METCIVAILSYSVPSLQLMLCGMQDLDVDEWEKHTVYRNYSRNSKQIHWFWQVCVCVCKGRGGEGGQVEAHLQLMQPS